MKNSHVSILALVALGFYLFMSKQAPLGIRSNNPLNIRNNGIAWEGLVKQDSGYAVFESSFYGLRAGARVLRTYRFNYGLKTPEQIISRWAPPVENDTESYINHVSSALGIDRNQDIPVSDYPMLMAVMIKHENGQQPYSSAEIIQGFNAGFYDG